MSYTPYRDRVGVGELLCSDSSKYLVKSIVGQGSFGTVAKCVRIADMKTVAIKMMKRRGSLGWQAREEVAILLKLKLLDSDKCNLVRWYQVFTCKKHICLEFEHLDKSLHDFMEDRYFRPLHLKEIRPIVQQLANALDHLKAAGIIHTDLKLENIMLVNHAREPYRVKVIDFGLAREVSAASLGSYVQTRPYRSPEIILGLPFTEAIDMWSLGCITASLYLGKLLYPASSEYDMMRYIVETQGQPPDTLLNRGYKTSRFFQQVNNSTNSSWKLKTPKRYFCETGIMSRHTRTMKFNLLRMRVISSEETADKVTESNDMRLFVDMLNGMLELDATKRLVPRQVIKHEFTSMGHMVSMYHLSSYVRSCFELMELCQNKNLTTDSGKAVGGSLQQSSSGTSHPVQQDLPSASAERSTVSLPQCINPQPCSSTQTLGSVNSGMKRIVDDENETMSETPHWSKRVRSRRHRGHWARLSTSNSTQNSDNHMQVSTAVRTLPAQAHSSNISQTQCSIRPATKRQADVEDVGHHHDDGRKRVMRSHAAPSTSSSSCISPREKTADGDDSDHHQLSNHERKRFRRSHAAPPTCSSRASTRRTRRI